MPAIEQEIEKFFFRTKEFWNNMPLSIYKELKKQSTIINFKKNEVMYSEGTYPKGFYILRKGTAKQYLINSDGKEQIIYFLIKSDFYGYRSLIGNKTTLFFISALEDCVVEIIDKEVFFELIQNSIVFNRLLLTHIGNEYRVLINRIAFFSLRAVNERIALTILLTNQKINSLPERKRKFHISKADMANFAGTIPETLSRFLKVQKEAGIIEVSGRKIIIVNKPALVQIANIM